MKCEASKKCKKEAIFNLYRINADLSKDWLNVCDEHEQKIGETNMLIQGYNPIPGAGTYGKQLGGELCPNCGAHLLNWQQVFGEEHKCEF